MYNNTLKQCFSEAASLGNFNPAFGFWINRQVANSKYPERADISLGTLLTYFTSQALAQV